MEYESFEDESVAALLNEHFVAIKVDREERPDIDAVYMNVCQALTGNGGWPLTLLLTPDQKPFYAATYLPKEAKYGMLGIRELLTYVWEEWEKDRDTLTASGSEIMELLNERTEQAPSNIPLTPALFDKALRIFSMQFDKEYGGFGSAPKFPAPHHLLFLLRYGALQTQDSAMIMAEKTLEGMYRGGIFDQIGGGFSRYSTDRRWLVPHFEKMLYDNALLLHAYLEAYRVTDKDLYCHVAQKTIRYILREMTDAKGGFYCAQDADSEGVEGKYYVFTPQEIVSLLGDIRGNAFNKHFSISPGGNFDGKSIPNLIGYAGDLIPDSVMDNCCGELYQYRLQRARLNRDDKILVSWNALMISAMANASVILQDEECLRAARRAEAFVYDNLSDGKGKLYVRYRQGESAGDGTIDDYAFFIWALLELYRATFDAAYLAKAVTFAHTMIRNFFDAKHGGFYLYGNESEQLISRPKEVYDGAMPSGNSVAAFVLGCLVRLTANETFAGTLDKQTAFVNETAHNNPYGFSFGLLALMNVVYPSKELVCAVSRDSDLDQLHRFSRQHPEIEMLVKTVENSALLENAAPFTKSYPALEQGSLFYLCSNRTCAAPVDSLDKLVLA